MVLEDGIRSIRSFLELPLVKWLNRSLLCTSQLCHLVAGNHESLENLQCPCQRNIWTTLKLKNMLKLNYNNNDSENEFQLDLWICRIGMFVYTIRNEYKKIEMEMLNSLLFYITFHEKYFLSYSTVDQIFHIMSKDSVVTISL